MSRETTTTEGSHDTTATPSRRRVPVFAAITAAAVLGAGLGGIGVARATKPAPRPSVQPQPRPPDTSPPSETACPALLSPTTRRAPAACDAGNPGTATDDDRRRTTTTTRPSPPSTRREPPSTKPSPPSTERDRPRKGDGDDEREDGAGIGAGDPGGTQTETITVSPELVKVTRIEASSARVDNEAERANYVGSTFVFVPGGAFEWHPGPGRRATSGAQTVRGTYQVRGSTISFDAEKSLATPGGGGGRISFTGTIDQRTGEAEAVWDAFQDASFVPSDGKPIAVSWTRNVTVTMRFPK